MPTKTKAKKQSTSALSANLPALLAIGIILTSFGALASATDSETVQSLCMVVSAAGVAIIGVVIGVGVAGRSK